MTERIRIQLDELRKREYRKTRTHKDMNMTEQLAGMDEMMRNANLMRIMMESQEPRFATDDRIGFHRSQIDYPYVINENGDKIYLYHGCGNIIPDYEPTLKKGMDALLAEVRNYRAKATEDKYAFYDAVIYSIEAALALADRYRDYCKDHGNQELYEALCVVPHKPAETFLQACVFLKFLIFTIRCNGNDHVAIGRFDQYMYPYFVADREKGMTEEQLFETIQEFFVSLNFDTDLYYGVQQGDNGQSMVLGGYAPDGTDMYNDLSRLCMEASIELQLIDPKINLRVNKTTPMERYVFGTKMTMQGLGFPQYSNDDVAIPALIRWGYDPEDAYNYAMAACWEFIIPGKAMDIVNIFTVNLARAVREATDLYLKDCTTFAEFKEKIRYQVEARCDYAIEKSNEKRPMPSPYMGAFVEGCIQKGIDVTCGGPKYNNFGMFGVGIASGADSMAAIEQAIFIQKICAADELVQALKDDFVGHDELRNFLMSCPKMGNNDDYVDQYGQFLVDAYADALEGKPNRFGGIFRAGTGSAMGYVKQRKFTGATPDGRREEDPFGSSLSPTLLTKLNGPLSCIQSFAKLDLSRAMNGGPLTMEIHDTVFHHQGGVEKVAALVKAFIDLGGHQLQLNSVNRELLLAAQANPEEHPNLIVRVWGWSGYFVELDKEYQDHVIHRTEFTC